MQNFDFFLDKTGEVGFVTQIFESIVYVEGLPGAHPNEVVIFETGQIGYILSLNAQTVEVLVTSPEFVLIGSRVTRTEQQLQIRVRPDFLGKIFSSESLEKELLFLGGTAGKDEGEKASTDKKASGDTNQDEKNTGELRVIDDGSIPFAERTKLTKPLTTGVKVVDLLVPLAHGQRQLIIGDRKTGKTNFLLQTIRNQIAGNTICVYAAVGKPNLEIQRVVQFFQDQDLRKNTVVISSASSDRPGLIFLTPYVAMTIAEYFRDQGNDVLVVLDDLTTHARFYREVSLLAKRFPGRNSYPGDIFYAHARLVERAGSSAKGAITCFPVAQSVQGDLSGYIQTNLMAMTDGHIFFDSNLFDEGKQPSINPFLSVTRVGEQVQTSLVRELGRQLRSFLVHFQRIEQFKHFQRELSDEIQENFSIGEKLNFFLNQTPNSNIPITMGIFIATAIWSGWWKEQPLPLLKEQIDKFLDAYAKNQTFRKQIDELVKNATSLTAFRETLKENREVLMSVTDEEPMEQPTTKQSEAQPKETAQS